MSSWVLNLQRSKLMRIPQSFSLHHCIIASASVSVKQLLGNGGLSGSGPNNRIQRPPLPGTSSYACGVRT